MLIGIKVLVLLGGLNTHVPTCEEAAENLKQAEAARIRCMQTQCSERDFALAQQVFDLVKAKVAACRTK